MGHALVAVRSNRPRAGKRFEPVEERTLAGDALMAANALANGRRVMIVEELAGPFGVPDFVAVVLAGDALERRTLLDVPPLLNEIDAGIVASVSSLRGTPAKKIAERLGWPLPSIERRIPTLLRTGALSLAAPDRYVKPADLQPIGRLYAIETKMSNWRRAVQQGRLYRLWTDNYVIVMPPLSNGSLADLSRTVTEDRAGLMIGGRWAARPGRRDASHARRMWGSEHVVAGVAGGHPTRSTNPR
ncbi:MAG: hypothetical protein WKF94_11975 [Solirubrobacteraceae bacterium]